MTATFNQPLQIRARLGGLASRVGQGLRTAATAVRDRLTGRRRASPGAASTSNSPGGN